MVYTYLSKYRNSQPTNMQTGNQSQRIYHQNTPAPKAWETMLKSWQKKCKSQQMRVFAVKLLPRYFRICVHLLAKQKLNKDSTNESAKVDRQKPQRPQCCTNNYRQLKSAEISTREEYNTNCLSIKNGQLTKHIYNNFVQTEQFIFRNICIYTHTHI